METFAWAAPEALRPRVAVLLPGAGYSVEAPMLHWCATMLADRGWRVQAVRWSRAEIAGVDPAAFVEDAVARALFSAPAPSQTLIVAKSFGTHAAAWAVRERVPGLWLTPVMTSGAIIRALRESGPESIALGGSLDPLWIPEALCGSRITRHTVEGANHALESGGWRSSIDAQLSALAQLEQRVVGLEAHG